MKVQWQVIRAKTEYALTDRRAIIVSQLFNRKVRSVNLDATPEIGVSERSDGSGTITFGPVTPFYAGRGQNPFFPGQSAVPAFEMIESARSVYDIIEKAKRG